jgi:hypothetical protein
VLALLLSSSAIPATACSAVACIDHGIEFNQTFEVVFTHDGRILQGVAVKVTDATANLRFSGITPPTGSHLVVSLPQGDYWLDADFLGIGAVYQCFHVAARPSRRAKRRMSYEWGTLAPATRRIAGKLVDSQAGTGGNPFWNITHRVNVPITEARLRLENPFTRQIYSTVSDQNGAFAFAEVPDGTYALHIEGGGSGRVYEPSDLLIRLSPSANRDSVSLLRRNGGGGSCGGTSLELSNTSPAVNR